MINTKYFNLNLSSHAFHDYRKVYEYLISSYGNTPHDCPAVLLLDSTYSIPLRDEKGLNIAVINRNSPRLLGDLKRTISKPAEVIDSSMTGSISSMISSDCNYWLCYKWLLEICEYLDIAVPALFICEKMPPFIDNLNGVCFPGGEVPYVTDVFMKLEKGMDEALWIKTFLHELRHVWQHKYHNDWFNGYESFGKEGPGAYYSQFVEVDADAFAYKTLENHGVRFILEDLGLERSKLIRKRMAEISAEKPLYLSGLPIPNKP